MLNIIREVVEASPDLYELDPSKTKYKKAWHVVSSVVVFLDL
jgi:hypothetical protein